MMYTVNSCAIRSLTAVLCGASLVHADEGMWLLNQPPTQLLADRYGFTPDAHWVEHVQKSCIRFGRGASASFVSPNGLVMTNHHVGYGQLRKLSTPDRDLIEDGFYAPTRDQELRCKDLEVKVLWSIEDVTDRVNSAVEPSMTIARANTARRGRIAEIEKTSEASTGLKSDVVTLYHGARYHLYRYKRFTDIRLVMAPEAGIASFGGDNDNFEYPRFCLDVTFFRIYEDGRPYRPEHYLTWSTSGPADGELTFIVGHPYSTDRLLTVEHLEFFRDVKFPTILKRLWRREVQVLGFAGRSDEHARWARSDLGRAQNSRKAFTGMIAGLHDPELMKRKAADQRALRAAVDADPKYQAQWGDAWDQVAQAQRVHRALYERYSALEGRRAVISSDLFRIARKLVRLAEELPKPNAERLENYQDAALDSLYLSLYSPAPIYETLEIDRIAGGLSYLVENYGGDDPLVKLALAGQGPRSRAESLVRGTTLQDVEVRKRLASEPPDSSGAERIANSTDPMIRFAADLEPDIRVLRKRYEDQVESVERAGYAKIAAARFAIGGTDNYPNATSSLRLAFGPIRGYSEEGRTIPPFTDFAGLYRRMAKRHGLDPFDLPDRWIERKDKLDLSTPFNFVCTADITGGNSGSPVINRQGEVIGIVFDGNLQGLVWDIAYTDHQARAVSVDARAIIESLRQIYDAAPLTNELLGGR